MRGKAITILAVVVLMAAALSLTQARALLAWSGFAAESSSMSMVGESTTCNSCSDCTTKLKSGSWDAVILATDITNHAGTCIGLILGESDVAFDCDGHTIDGDDAAVDPDHGVAMMHGTGNAVRNCTISGFSNGIYLWDATNHAITDNILVSNGTGIQFGWSDFNQTNSNTIADNYTGIQISDSNNNAIISNTVCENEYLDFNLVSGTGNSGSNNTCDSPDGWNDDGTTGCTNICAGTTTCSSCSDCSSKLNGTFDTVMLTQDINNHAGTCITFGASNVVFDGNGHRIDGDDSGTDYGITMSGKSGNTIKNCTVTDFHHGIYLYGSSGNTVTRSSANSNTGDGIHLYNSSGNTIAVFNEVRSNGRFGIFLNSSNSNAVYFNNAISNDNVGIRLSNADSNTITFNGVLDNNNTNAWGIYMYSSDSNTVSNNNVVGNYYGIKFDNSHSNTLNANKICSNPDVDFSLVGGSSGNSGDNNTCCASPAQWNDIGETGCTFACDTEPDRNGNGISDACDCYDAHQGLNETGIDCGGICPACRAVPSGWSNVAGVRLRGAPNSGFIDVVFVPEQSYSGNLAAFEAAVTDLVANWYLRLDDMSTDPLPADYRDKFNFYRYTGGFGTQTGCSGGLPSNFWNHAPSADVAAILAAPGSGAWGCANGLGPPGGQLRFIALADRQGQVIHESGHAIFGLVDQYCGDTHYEQTTPTTNVWSSFSGCQSDATAQGWSGGNCRQIASTGCSKSFWKYDPTGLMDGSGFLCTSGDVCTLSADAFGEACGWRLGWAFDNWPVGSSKGILVHFNISQGVIKELGSEVVGGHPDVGLQTEDLRVELLSSNGAVLQEYGIWDPRYEIGDGGTLIYTDDVDFSLIFPAHAGIRTANIYDPDTEELKVSVDFSALECTCDSCPDCQAKLQDPACLAVRLTADIIDHAGSCVSLIMGESDTVFDCDGHIIDGDDIAIDPEHGIALMHGTGNVVRNCTVSGFSRGIYLWDAADHVLAGNTLISNGIGVELGWSDANHINHNRINENYNGIVIGNSNRNTIYSNVVCRNENLDFELVSGTGNSGNDNRCDKPDGWNDDGTTGCSSACTETALYLSPPQSTLGISDTVTLDVMVGNVQDLYGVEFYVSFDPDLVQVQDAIPGGDVNIIPGDFLQPGAVVHKNYVNNSTGEIEYVQTREGPVPGAHGSGALARIVFHGKAAGTSPVAFTLSTLSDPGSVPIEHEIFDGKITVSMATGSVEGKVILERRVAYPNANAGATIALGTQSQVTGSDGAYSFTNVPAGTHQIKVIHPSYLPSWRNVDVTSGGTTVLPNLTLLGGDCSTSQGIIDGVDAVAMGKAWGTSPGNPDWNPRADVRDDSVINVLDFTAVKFNWMRTAPGPWAGSAALGGSARQEGEVRPLGPALNPQTSMFISPPIVTTSVGLPVTVEIWIQDVEDLYGAGFALAFDASVVNVQDANPFEEGVQIESGSWLERQLEAANSADNSSGQVQFFVTQSRPATARSGSGILARITFVGVAEGSSTLQFTSWQLVDDEENVVPATAQDGQVMVKGGHRIYLPLVLRSG